MRCEEMHTKFRLRIMKERDRLVDLVLGVRVTIKYLNNRKV